MATQTLTKPEQDQTVEDKIQQLRQLYADTPQFAKTALENTLKDLTSEASQPRSRMESAGRTGSPSGQGLGVDRHRPVRTRRSHAAARVAAVVEGQLSTTRTRLAPSTTCVSCSSITTQSCSSPLPTTAIGTPISTTSWRRFPTKWTSSTSAGTAGRGFTARGERLDRQAPDHGRRLVRRLSGSDRGGHPTAEAHRQGGRRIPRQDRLRQRSRLGHTERRSSHDYANTD